MVFLPRVLLSLWTRRLDYDVPAQSTVASLGMEACNSTYLPNNITFSMDSLGSKELRASICPRLLSKQ